MWKSASILFFVSLLLILYSCAVKRAELPDYSEVGLEEFLASRGSINSIDTRFSIVFEKDETEMRGEGALNLLKNGDLLMRIYSFGFLAFEMTSQGGIVKSNPPIDRNRGVLLSEGLRDCLFWWDMKNFSVEEDESTYMLQNTTRSLWINRKTLLPLQQVISLTDGRELIISYANPDFAGTVWYPARIRIELARYAVTLTIREISFLPDNQSKINPDSLDNRTVDSFCFGQVSFQKGIIANSINEPRRSFRTCEYLTNRLF